MTLLDLFKGRTLRDAKGLKSGLQLPVCD